MRSNPMTNGNTKVWFITSAGRGMGVEIARAALAAGNAVVATARTIGVLSKAVGQADALWVFKRDVTSPADAQALVTISGQQPPPRHFIAGADAIAIAEQKAQGV